MAKGIKINEIIQEVMLRDGNTSGSYAPTYKSYARAIVRDLKLFNLRETKRRQIAVNQDTKSIELPDDCLEVVSITYKDECGKYQPLYFNSDLTKDNFIEVQESTCGCTKCNCTSEMCHAIKEYKTIEEEVLVKIPRARFIPVIKRDDGSSACTDCELPTDTLPTYEHSERPFTKTTKTIVCENGDIKEIICEPTIRYKTQNAIPIVNKKTLKTACKGCGSEATKETDYIFDGVEDVCTETIKCNLELKECGCPTETKENETKIIEACGVCCKPSPMYGTACGGQSLCCGTSKESNKIFNQDGCKIEFPQDFTPKNIIIKYYTTYNYTEEYIPEIAREAAILGIQYKMWMGIPSKISASRLLREEYVIEKRKVDMLIQRLSLNQILSAVLGDQNKLNNTYSR